jgi:Ca2+-binding RTX toxin-like protein
VTVNLATGTASGGDAAGDTFSSIENLTGSAFADVLTGEGNANTLDGGAGADTLVGGDGNDIYIVDNSGDVVTEALNQGNDEVRTSLATYVLAANVEDLTGTLNTGQVLVGNTLANTITGGIGADTLVGGDGNDIYIVDNAGDVIAEGLNQGNDEVRTSLATYVLADNVENLTGRLNTGQSLVGNTLANTIMGGAGNDTLDGGTGDDTLNGGAGNDTYVVDSINDLTIENANAGIDTVEASTHYRLLANLENLTLLGGSDLQAYGNALANTLTSNSGIDLLSGGAGDDTYVVNSTSDAVLESANEGTDTVQATVHYRLAANVENLTLLGTANLQAYGNADANVLTSNTGVDLLSGGAGDDTYVVNNTSDAVLENANEGTDTVQATVDYRLAANVENLTLLGTANLQAYGNSGANTLTSNTGIDLLAGGDGDDTYFVKNASDVVLENANEGTDTVHTSVHYGLAANLENLVLDGSADLQGYGNGGANALTGNSGNNLLNGGAGADTMSGGAGNDTYFMDDPGDLVIESANAGTDAVFATVTYTLADNVETLVLQGSGNLDGTGNTLANKLYGNTGDNTLDGGAAADVLTGAAGNDTFLFHAGEANGDIVLDFAGNGAGAGDSLQFVGFGTTGDGATFTQVGATNQWVIHSGLGGLDETITLMNSATVDPTDVLFV